MRKMRLFPLITTCLAALVAPLLAACVSNVVYDHYEPTPVYGWEKNDTLTYDIPPLAAAATYKQEVGLRTNNAFPFTTLSLIVERHVLPRGGCVTDTIRCTITDDRGNIKGDGISAYQYAFPLGETQLNKGDSLHITIRHNMKREIIPGVSDVGIKMSFSD